MKFQDLNKGELESNQKDVEKVIVVTQLDANIALRLANRVNQYCGEKFHSIWILDDSFSIRKFKKSSVPLQ